MGNLDKTYYKIIKKSKNEKELDDIVLKITLKDFFVHTIKITGNNFHYECKKIENDNKPFININNLLKNEPASYIKKINNTIGFSLIDLFQSTLNEKLIKKMKFIKLK